MKKDPRETAFHLLESGQKKTVTLDRAIDNASGHLDELSSQDRSLCNAIVFGTLRYRGCLDHIIRGCSDRPFDRIDPKVLTLLRLGVFQVRYLDRVPDFAAIHTTMELAKKKTGKKTAGFINAVLRKAAAEHDTIPLPDKKKKFPMWLSAACSIPPWLGKRWARLYGRQEAERLSRNILDIPPITLRVNTLRTTREDLLRRLSDNGIHATKTRHSNLGINLKTSGRPVSNLPGFNKGWFQVQDEAAQLVSTLLNPKSGDRILDACAGLGTKTCHMAQLMENKGQIIANDPDSGKQTGLVAETRRLGVTQVCPVSFDITGARLDDFGGYFDRVLVDAPCTGLGVLRRNPDTRWKRTSKDILRMAALQKKILNSAANLVSPGGRLVYAVCSCEPEENEGVIDHFLAKRKDFEPDINGFTQQLPRFADTPNSNFYYRTYPFHTGMDGFFTARMRRRPNK